MGEWSNGGDRAELGTQDLHVHTTMSDGDLSLAVLLEVARERGVAVGIADHVSTRNPDFISTAAKLEIYLRELEKAPVFRSAELCWCDPFSTDVARRFFDRFDYLVGSNHGFTLPDGTFASPWGETVPAGWTDRPGDLMEIMVHNLCDMVARMPISIAGHPTLLPPSLLTLDPDIHVWWTEEREDRFIEATVRSGVALEISNRYRLPHDRFLRKAREAGARFSLGSDGHHADQVARLEWATAAARRAGISEGHLFVPERRVATSG